MNESTDKAIDDKGTALVAFYREQLLPLAEVAQRRGLELFPLGPEVEAHTYFIDRADDGDYIHTIDAASLARELHKMWRDDELPELATLAEPLADLARALHEKETVSDEVSPFIYAMF